MIGPNNNNSESDDIVASMLADPDKMRKYLVTNYNLIELDDPKVKVATKENMVIFYVPDLQSNKNSYKKYIELKMAQGQTEVQAYSGLQYELKGSSRSLFRMLYTKFLGQANSVNDSRIYTFSNKYKNTAKTIVTDKYFLEDKFLVTIEFSSPSITRGSVTNFFKFRHFHYDGKTMVPVGDIDGPYNEIPVNDLFYRRGRIIICPLSLVHKNNGDLKCHLKRYYEKYGTRATNVSDPIVNKLHEVMNKSSHNDADVIDKINGIINFVKSKGLSYKTKNGNVGNYYELKNKAISIYSKADRRSTKGYLYKLLVKDDTKLYINVSFINNPGTGNYITNYFLLCNTAPDATNSIQPGKNGIDLRIEGQIYTFYVNAIISALLTAYYEKGGDKDADARLNKNTGNDD